MRTLFFLLLLLITSQATSQETFVKIYDFFDGVDEATPRNMFVIDDQVHILGSGDCGALRCLHYYVLNTIGEVVWTRRYPHISPSLYCDLRDSSIYLGGRMIQGDTLESKDGFRIFELDLNGELIGTVKYDQYELIDVPDFEINSYNPIGAIANDDKIVVYGDTREADAINDNFRRGLLMYYNKDLSFDTLVFIQPRYRDTEMWNADLDSKNNFVFLFDYDEFDGVGDVDYRTVARYDSYGNELFRYEPPELFGESEAFISFSVLSDDKMIYELENEKEDRSNDLLVIDDAGNTEWRKYQDFGNVSVGTLTISEASNQSLLVAGFSKHVYFYGSHITKFDAETGDLIWERAYLDWTDEVSENVRTSLWAIEELSDGTILVAGTRKDRKRIDSLTIASHDDLYLMRLDSLGCLEPGCGGLEQHIAGQPKYIDITNHIHRWLYQKYDTPLGIFKQRYRYVSLVEMYQENRAEEELGIISDEGWFHGSPTKLLRPENEGRKVYYIADYDISQEEVLLYDFTLEVGDLFMSDYIAQPLEVIESDTMRLSDRSKMRYWVLACTQNPENTITWIENIGTYHAVVWPSNFCSGDYGDETLTCFYRHERFAHMNPAVSDCLLPSSTDEKVMDTLSEITAIPNPTSGFITISAPDDLQIARLELLDTNGVTHESFPVKTSEVSMDLSGYPSGLYFVSVHTEQGSVVKKVVVDD